MNIAQILQEHARSRPHGAAIIDTVRGKARITTFAELENQAARAATLLEHAGLVSGDVVLVFQPMSAELYVALLALFRLGLVAMFLDPASGRDHFTRCCALCQPRAFLACTKAHFLRFWSSALWQIPRSIVIGWPFPFALNFSKLHRMPPKPDIFPCSPDTPALLTFTSGSTGQPKGTVRSHGFLLAQYHSLVESLELTPGDVDLATLPIVLLANLASGVTSVIPDVDLRFPGNIKPEPVLKQIKRHAVVSSVASPAFFECLTRFAIEHNITLPTVTKVFTGGAPVLPRLLDQLHQFAPRARIVALYGSTEAEPIAHIDRHELRPEDRAAMYAGKGLLTGKPVNSVRLRVLRDHWGKPIGPFTVDSFSQEFCQAGEAGEIVVTGDHVLTGYLHGQGDEETKFRVDGVVWHRTGDAGYLDEENRLWLLGRCAARIADEKGLLYPFAGEVAAYQDGKIKRAALIARHGKRLLILEYYDPKFPGDIDRLRKDIAWIHLDEIIVLPHIPVDKRHNAKVDYPSLYSILDRRP